MTAWPGVSIICVFIADVGFWLVYLYTHSFESTQRWKNVTLLIVCLLFCCLVVITTQKGINRRKERVKHLHVIKALSEENFSSMANNAAVCWNSLRVRRKKKGWRKIVRLAVYTYNEKLVEVKKERLILYA